MSDLKLVAEALRAEAEALSTAGPGALLGSVLCSIAARLEARDRRLEGLPAAPSASPEAERLERRRPLDCTRYGHDWSFSAPVRCLACGAGAPLPVEALRKRQLLPAFPAGRTEPDGE